MRQYFNYIFGGLLIACVSTYMTYRLTKGTIESKPPQQIVIEWEINKELDEKTMVLPNGVVLTLAKFSDEEKNKKWEWSVSGVSSEERQAIETLFRLGGVK